MALSREEIAARYGAALFGYAQDMKVLDQVFAELQELQKAVKANPAIVNVLSDPILNKDEKKASLDAIEKDFSDEVQGFLNLLLEYDRFEYLLDIIARFNYLYDQEKSIASGTAITAVKLDDDQLKRLGDSYAKKYNLNAVRLENQVDPSIIGGVILQIKDRVIDGSVKNRLKKIRAQLIDEN
ncbi:MULTISPECIES: ATP synthase F1 subunit delta [Lactobacillus]|uniref:ATP synthase subunit delta n=1 Tax=Lactobacillus xujianguonis TaxID=2495899 RepID=A0A437SWH1_9LACO|nr:MULTISPECIES: ATP synthase F1 subunit delta [Lactobacillus]RVU71269.1 F0F1 ATP synthase subunit delta [Lactobacillus xujianguonis]RVU74083.1 F0F1 ATP synthase subunit delta [Lactobacillus xujianguonis]